ncbi:MAG: spondin domain-containing protein [Bacteroidota bacterium]
MGSKILLFLVLSLFTLFNVSCEKAVPDTEAEFTVTIRNLSEGENATVLSAGIFYTNQSGFPLFFKLSLDYGHGLEFLAEDGIVDSLLQSLEANQYVKEFGRFQDIFPGGQDVSFTFTGQYGDFFNFATMFTDSNDGFYSFDEEGVLLFEPDGTPFEGDITKRVWLWDAGTELNERPYQGESQPGRSMFFEGEEEQAAVRLMDDQWRDEYPELIQVIQIVVTANKQ